MPASRSARAMIFAPRSWPSSPGLATTTRILRVEMATGIRGMLVHDELHLLVLAAVDRADDRVGAALAHLLPVRPALHRARAGLHRTADDLDVVDVVASPHPLDARALGDGHRRHPARADEVVVADLDPGRRGRAGGERGEQGAGEHDYGECEQLAQGTTSRWERLEDGRLGVGAEDFLQRPHDLALGGVYARAVEEVRHQVVVVLRGRRLQRRERPLDGGAVAARAHRVHAADLLALERRVDAQDRRPAVVALE